MSLCPNPQCATERRAMRLEQEMRRKAQERAVTLGDLLIRAHGWAEMGPCEHPPFPGCLSCDIRAALKTEPIRCPPDCACRACHAESVAMAAAFDLGRVSEALLWSLMWSDTRRDVLGIATYLNLGAADAR